LSMSHGSICLNMRMGRVTQLQLVCHICHRPLREDFEHGCLICTACGQAIAVQDAITALEDVWFQLATLMNALRESREAQHTAQELFVEASQVAQRIAPFV